MNTETTTPTANHTEAQPGATMALADVREQMKGVSAQISETIDAVRRLAGPPVAAASSDALADAHEALAAGSLKGRPLVLDLSASRFVHPEGEITLTEQAVTFVHAATGRKRDYPMEQAATWRELLATITPIAAVRIETVAGELMAMARVACDGSAPLFPFAVEACGDVVSVRDDNASVSVSLALDGMAELCHSTALDGSGAPKSDHLWTGDDAAVWAGLHALLAASDN